MHTIPSRRSVLTYAGVQALTLSASLPACSRSKTNMAEIKFDLGKNIKETARASGVPSFSTSNISGLVMYSVNAVPPSIPAHYTRPNYEIIWQPIFAFIMYSDGDRDPALGVQSVKLQLDSDSFNNNHAKAQAFVEQTLAQFVKGKWQRYCLPSEILLTGRSSMLDEAGGIARILYTLDPTYKIPAVDWPAAAMNGLWWRWEGDGIVAGLSVNASPGEDGTFDYRMNLDFDVLTVKLAVDAENLARDLEQGDAKGWNSTAKYEAGLKKSAEQNKRLEANAIKRGDSVVSRPR